MSSPQYAKNQPAGFSNKIERVAIVGAGGQVGTRLAEALVATGKHTVTAITRVGSKSKVPEGVKSTEVDYDNEQSVVDALKGNDFFIISMAVTAPEGTEAKLIQAAAKAGIPWVMPNCYGGDVTDREAAKRSVVVPGYLAAIDQVVSAGVSSWVTLNPSYWYEYSLSFPGGATYGIDVANKTATFFDQGAAKIDTSTWQQCGRAVASLLSLKVLPEDESDKSTTLSNWRNKPVYINSFHISQRDMLDSVQRVTGTTDADWTIDHEPTQERFSKAMTAMQSGDQSAFVKVLYTGSFLNDGDSAHMSLKYGTANEALGLPKEKIDDATKRAVDMSSRGYNAFTNRN